MSVPINLRFMPADAFGGNTLKALLPSILVSAQVVRSIAFNSPPDFLQTRSNSPSKHHKLANKIL